MFSYHQPIPECILTGHCRAATLPKRHAHNRRFDARHNAARADLEFQRILVAGGFELGTILEETRVVDLDDIAMLYRVAAPAKARALGSSQRTQKYVCAARPAVPLVAST